MKFDVYETDIVFLKIHETPYLTLTKVPAFNLNIANNKYQLWLTISQNNSLQAEIKGLSD